jgi:hypothetical protein
MELARADLEAIERQLGRAPRALVRVAARCPNGGPAVLEQAPYAADGTPFPTTYWLSCRRLVEAVNDLESAGGVRAFEDELAADAQLAADREAVEQRVSARRASLAPAGGALVDGGAALRTGIGGVAPGGGLKCLHAHAAVALAAGPYALGSRILQRAGVRHGDGCCAWE